ncbi:MAG TPA: preprotein translocase subunit SecG [Methylophilaceae bacterium]|jgi:preprotein translocase subunit SecG
METLVTVVHVLAAMGVIGLVLLQHGKGADMGAAFGSGASGSLFGVSGSSNFMSRATAIFVAIFFATSMTLAYLSSHRAEQSSVISLQKKSVTTPTQNTSKPADKPVDSSSAKDVPK